MVGYRASAWSRPVRKSALTTSSHADVIRRAAVRIHRVRAVLLRQAPDASARGRVADGEGAARTFAVGVGQTRYATIPGRVAIGRWPTGTLHRGRTRRYAGVGRLIADQAHGAVSVGQTRDAAAVR